MSRPQNNLDDLKRRAQTGPAANSRLQSQSQESSIQPKNFKFKSSTGLGRAPVVSTPGSSSTSTSVTSNPPKQQAFVAGAKPAPYPTHKPASRPEPRVESELLGASLPNTMAPRRITSSPSSSSPSTVPLKRSSSDTFVASKETNKRTKVENSSDNKEVDMLHAEWDAAEEIWREREMEAEAEARSVPKALQSPRPAAHPKSASVYSGISSSLLADYEGHTLEELNTMVISNVAARMEVLDKIVRMMNGLESGLDRAMLQESCDNLELRIAAIRAVINARESGVPPRQVARVNIPAASSGVPFNPRPQPPYPPSALPSTMRIPPIHCPSPNFDNSDRINEVSTISTKNLSITCGTNGTVVSSSEKNVAFTSVDTEDEEDAMWAQLDDVSTEVLDFPVSSSSNCPNIPLQPIGNILDRHQSPGKRQTFKSAESSSRDANLVDQTNTPYYSEIMRTLRNVFNLDSFRPNQLEAINATMSGKDVFVLMPTGGGKSLCYQVPAVCQNGSTSGVSVVVSPLIALMIDQVHHLEQRGVDVVLFNSDQGHERSREARARLTSRGSKPKLLYVTPEKLHKSNDMKSILAKLYRDGQLARFVIDEAHCVSTWGRDFREAYQDLDRLRQEYPSTPIMALTATANEQVMNDVIDRLGIQKCVLLTQSFNRPNLHYEVRPKKRNLTADINAFIQKSHRGHTGIIYCLSRNKCEEVAKELREKYGLKAKHYHAQMSVEDKQRSQMAWQSGECDIIVATIAFGMGIDKPDVRFVIHHSLPMSLDGYYQETGRAGRDGKPATCVLFYSYGDTKILFKLIQEGENKTVEEKKRQEDGVRSVVQYCQNEIDCRRVQVLGYFGQVFDPKDCRKRCNNCLENADFFEQDMSDSASKAIRLVMDISRDGNVTKLYCLDVFRGANIKAIRDKGHDRLQLFGAGSPLSREQGERLFDHLLSLEGFRQVSVANKSGWNTMYMQLGPAANDFLTGKRQLKMMVKVTGETSKTTKSTVTKPKRKPGKVASVNRSQGDDIFDDVEEDNTCVDLSKDVIDMDDIYDFGSSPPRPAASTRRQSPKGRKAKGSRRAHTEPTNIAEDSDDVSQRCYKELLMVRDEIAEDLNLNPENVVEESLLQIISAILPTDHASFKEVLNENLSSAEADKMWNNCGRRILEVCANHKMSSSSMREPRLPQKFDAVELHAKFDFHASTSSTNSSSHRTSKTKAGSAVVKSSSKGGSIRAMPL